jgi:hypothetical protein
MIAALYKAKKGPKRYTAEKLFELYAPRACPNSVSRDSLRNFAYSAVGIPPCTLVKPVEYLQTQSQKFFIPIKHPEISIGCVSANYSA